MATQNVRTARGVVHSVTIGREYKLQGHKVVNEAGKVTGKADCGSLTSGAAIIVTEPVTCSGCEGL